MNIELITVTFCISILGVVFIYPLFFTKALPEVKSKLVKSDHRATYEKDIKKVIKLLILLIVPILLHVVMSSSDLIEFSKETYSFLGALATILLVFIL